MPESLQVQADVQSQPPEPAESRIPDPNRLSRHDEAMILKLAEDGRTQTEIAQLIGTTQPTVSRVLSAFGDTRSLAKRIAHNAAAKLTKRVIDDADVDQALEVLDRIGVMEKRDTSGKGQTINIVAGAILPGL